MKKNFEKTNDFNGAKAAAVEIAKQFTDISGKVLKPIEHPEIDSELYGWLNAENGIPNDPNARFVFAFDVNDYETVFIYPTSQKVVIWHSLTENNFEEEGALDPNTDEYEWQDEMFDSAYSLNIWKKYFA